MRLITIVPAIIAAALALTLMPTSSEAAPRKAAPTRPVPAETKQDPPTSKAPANQNRDRPTTNSDRQRPRTSDTEDGYTYTFSDDPLSGNSDAANAAVIRTRRAGTRRTLIRPRLHFVPELLKTVENL